MIDGQRAPPALADVFVDQDKGWTRDVIGHVQSLAHALDHAGLTAAQVAAQGDYIARDQVPTERNPQRVGLRRRMRGENLFHFPHLGSIIATGKIISSSDRPPVLEAALVTALVLIELGRIDKVEVLAGNDEAMTEAGRRQPVGLRVGD